MASSADQQHMINYSNWDDIYSLVSTSVPSMPVFLDHAAFGMLKLNILTGLPVWLGKFVKTWDSDSNQVRVLINLPLWCILNSYSSVAVDALIFAVVTCTVFRLSTLNQVAKLHRALRQAITAKNKKKSKSNKKHTVAHLFCCITMFTPDVLLSC